MNMIYGKANPHFSREFDIWIKVEQEGMTPENAKRAAIWSELMHTVGRRTCAKEDHKWVDDSHGGPESGCMAAHCKRCGHSFCTRLY